MKKIIKPTFLEESKLWNKGIDFVVGIDEVGRGAFAGPIVAAGVIYSSNQNSKVLCDVNDSKLLKPLLREKCSETVKENAKFYAIESIEIDYINKHGIGKANTAVFRKVLNKLITKTNITNYFILIDGFHRRYLPGGLKKQKGIIKGDQKSLSIASASILAKVYRDNLMKKANMDYPNYGFSSNKGYGTKSHREALKIYGISKFHRIDFVN